VSRRVRIIIAGAFAAVMLAGAGSSVAAEHHPPKFGPHDTQCSSGSNQPNCPGSH
jgi:hypothetical protein